MCGLVVLPLFLTCLEIVCYNLTILVVQWGESTHVARLFPATRGCKHMRGLKYKDAHGCKHAYTNAVRLAASPSDLWGTRRYNCSGRIQRVRSAACSGAAVISVSAAALCSAVVLEQLRGTPELFSIWCRHWRGGVVGWWGGTRTEATVLLMGHLDVWAYVIQSQRAASNRTPIAGILLRADRSAASLLSPGSRGLGNRSRQGPEACLSPSTSPSPNTNTRTYICINTYGYCPTAPATPSLSLMCVWERKDAVNSNEINDQRYWRRSSLQSPLLNSGQ